MFSLQQFDNLICKSIGGTFQIYAFLPSVTGYTVFVQNGTPYSTQPFPFWTFLAEIVDILDQKNL